MSAFHFTTSAHLPWILEAGELRADANRFGGFPSDFLWATTSADGSTTSSAQGRPQRAEFRAGRLLLVRITLPETAFVSWPEMIARSPEWTPKHVATLEASARQLGEDPDVWRCRRDPLPLGEALIETRGYRNKAWRPLVELKIVKTPELPAVRGLVVDGIVYAAQRVVSPAGAVAYKLFNPAPENS